MKRGFIGAWTCLWALTGTAIGQQDGPGPSISQVFQSAHFDRFVAEGVHQDMQFKVRAFTHGLSAHQRMVTHLEIDIPGAELVKRVADREMVVLVEVEDGEGHRYRDYGLIDLRPVTPDLHKHTWENAWEAFALPGRYKVRFLVYDGASGEHSFTETNLHVSGIKHDSFAEIWQGVPNWEFWAPLKDVQDSIYRSDIDSRLHLRLDTRERIQVDVLADLTPSGLFHGSSRFYSHFLSVALPLVRDLSEIQVSNGSLNVTALDLRQRRVTFEQDNVKVLNWGGLKGALAENGPGMIDVKGLEQKHEEPDFLRDEILRRLNISPSQAAEYGASDGQSGPCEACGGPDEDDVSPRESKGNAVFHVFIVVGSPMDFYAFHHFPLIPPEQAENCVVYYLQYQIYGPYATGATDKVSKMLKPLAIHSMKVRSAESVRNALGRILREVGER